MANVYVVNKSYHDFTPAKEFGNLEFMSEGALDRFDISKMYRMFKPFLERSEPNDYILLTGMSVMNSIACSMFAAKHGRVNLLIWKNKRGGGKYVEKVVVFN